MTASPTRVPLESHSCWVPQQLLGQSISGENLPSPIRVPLESHSSPILRQLLGQFIRNAMISVVLWPSGRSESASRRSLVSFLVFSLLFFFFLPFFVLFSFFFPFLFFSFFLSPFFSHLVRQAKTPFCFKEVVNWFCSKGTSSLLSVCSFLHFNFHAVSSGCSLLISFTSACLVDVVCFGKSTIYFIISFLQSTAFFSGLL